jgi:hypothetical protein
MLDLLPNTGDEKELKVPMWKCTEQVGQIKVLGTHEVRASAKTLLPSLDSVASRYWLEIPSRAPTKKLGAPCLCNGMQQRRLMHGVFQGFVGNTARKTMDAL